MNYGPQWEALLDEIDDFLEDQEDIRDGAEGEQLPNKAMSLLTSMRYLRPAPRTEGTATSEARLRAVLEGMECQRIDELMKQEPEVLRTVGKGVAFAAKLGSHLLPSSPLPQERSEA